MFVRACVYLGMWGMYIIAAAAVGMCSSLQLGLWMWCRLNLGGGGLLQVDAIGMVVDCCVAGHAASRVPVAAIDVDEPYPRGNVDAFEREVEERTGGRAFFWWGESLVRRLQKRDTRRLLSQFFWHRLPVFWGACLPENDDKPDLQTCACILIAIR